MLIEYLMTFGYMAAFMGTFATVMRRSWQIKEKASAKTGKTKKVIVEPDFFDYTAAVVLGFFWPAFWAIQVLGYLGNAVRPQEVRQLENEQEIRRMEKEAGLDE